MEICLIIMIFLSSSPCQETRQRSRRNKSETSRKINSKTHFQTRHSNPSRNGNIKTRPKCTNSITTLSRKCTPAIRVMCSSSQHVNQHYNTSDMDTHDVPAHQSGTAIHNNCIHKESKR